MGRRLSSGRQEELKGMLRRDGHRHQAEIHQQLLHGAGERSSGIDLETDSSSELPLFKPTYVAVNTAGLSLRPSV
jgi:hypothetical protein